MAKKAEKPAPKHDEKDEADEREPELEQGGESGDDPVGPDSSSSDSDTDSSKKRGAVVASDEEEPPRKKPAADVLRGAVIPVPNINVSSVMDQLTCI